MMPTALDLQLDDFLSQAVGESSTLPLAIRRFMREFGSLRPAEAMEIATARVLELYWSSLSSDNPFHRRISAERPNSIAAPISIERLCSIVGLDLIGAPVLRERVARGADYESAPRREHTGTLEFVEPRPIIRIPSNVGWNCARVAAAHEIGHALVHKRGNGYDQATIRLGSTPAEEALAEYASRLLLLPRELQERWRCEAPDGNYAVQCTKVAQRAHITLHAAVARLGDPDAENRQVRGAVFWRMVRKAVAGEVEEMLTPYWHLCPGAFIPIGRCRARKGSLIAELAAGGAHAAGSRIEQVSIGSLSGMFLIDAFAWGSLTDRTRVVLSVFRFAI